MLGLMGMTIIAVNKNATKITPSPNAGRIPRSLLYLLFSTLTGSFLSNSPKRKSKSISINIAVAIKPKAFETAAVKEKLSLKKDAVNL